MNDKKFLKWLSYQPSCLDGNFTQWDNGVGRNIACHVRRINRGAGMGIKPKFSAVPMTDAQHQMQTDHGEARVISVYLKETMTKEQAAEWFEQKADYYADKFRGGNPSTTP